MTTTENKLERYLRQRAEAAGADVFKFVSPGKRGVPDDIVIWPDGVLDFVELKTETGKLGPLQLHWQERLTDKHQNVFTLVGKADIDMYTEGRKHGLGKTDQSAS